MREDELDRFQRNGFSYVQWGVRFLDPKEEFRTWDRVHFITTEEDARNREELNGCPVYPVCRIVTYEPWHDVMPERPKAEQTVTLPTSYCGKRGAHIPHLTARGTSYCPGRTYD